MMGNEKMELFLEKKSPSPVFMIKVSTFQHILMRLCSLWENQQKVGSYHHLDDTTTQSPMLKDGK